jgi:hypothetical protein
MPLEESCMKFLGRSAFVLTAEGFGWSRIVGGGASGEPGEHIEPPAPFHVRVEEFHGFGGGIAAGVGTVQEAGHTSEGKWVAFCLRDRGEDIYDMSRRPGKYNVRIGERKPTISIDANLPMPQWMQFGDAEVLSGLGYVLDSETSLEEVFRRLHGAP